MNNNLVKSNFDTATNQKSEHIDGDLRTFCLRAYTTLTLTLTRLLLLGYEIWFEFGPWRFEIRLRDSRFDICLERFQSSDVQTWDLRPRFVLRYAHHCWFGLADMKSNESGITIGVQNHSLCNTHTTSHGCHSISGRARRQYSKLHDVSWFHMKPKL